jgi:hypothetical protein
VGAGVASQHVGPADGEAGADVLATEGAVAHSYPIELRGDADPGVGSEVAPGPPVHGGVI